MIKYGECDILTNEDHMDNRSRVWNGFFSSSRNDSVRSEEVVFLLSYRKVPETSVIKSETYMSKFLNNHQRFSSPSLMVNITL